MKIKLKELPTSLDVPGAKINATNYGNMTCGHMHISKGVDFTPLLRGLPHDHCPCPHWGYVVQGKIWVRYQDGTEETVETGDLYYWPPGHTVRFEADTEYIEFSPQKDMSEVLDHVISKLNG
mgnify:CR=1 FL=1